MKTFKTPKGTELPILDLRGKDYLQVAHRLVWFREQHPDWSIITEILIHSPEGALAKASIINEKGVTIATSHKTEDKRGFADFIEKAETGAIGRALAACGFGTQFAPDLDEGQRLADTPVNRSKPPQQNYAPQTAQPKPGQQKPTVRVTPEGSTALTQKQLELVMFQKKQAAISDESFLKIVNEVGGAASPERIPMPKVSDVLGAIQKASVVKTQKGGSTNVSSAIR